MAGRSNGRGGRLDAGPARLPEPACRSPPRMTAGSMSTRARPRRRAWDYVIDERRGGAQRWRRPTRAMTFCGHTHVPAVFHHDRRPGKTRRPSIRMRGHRDAADAAAALGRGDRRGRPAARPQCRPPATRSTTTAAGTLTYARRVPYDVETAAAQRSATPACRRSCAARLAWGAVKARGLLDRARPSTAFARGTTQAGCMANLRYVTHLDPEHRHGCASAVLQTATNRGTRRNPAPTGTIECRSGRAAANRAGRGGARAASWGEHLA